MMRCRRMALIVIALSFSLLGAVAAGAESVSSLKREFPRLDLTRRGVPLSDLKSGGLSRDGIPAIDAPRFEAGAIAAQALGPDEPVISLAGTCGAFAYPYRVLIWHEIVNDRVCGRPVAVTYCPLCNTAMVFDRRVAGRELTFGTTGRLRHSDLVMYDRETETFWQQFTGRSLLGALHDSQLVIVPARLESITAFRTRYPLGQVLIPPNGGRPYGRTPYVGYDRSPAPFLYSGRMLIGIEPLARVVRVGDRAWSLTALRRARRIVTNDGLEITWREGQNSALDKPQIAQGRDIGNVTVTRAGQDVAYSVDFAFAFAAFYPKGRMVK